MKGMRICKTCGKEYPYCQSVNLSGNKFRWQDVGCSIECAEKYFKAVAEDRGEVFNGIGVDEPKEESPVVAEVTEKTEEVPTPSVKVATPKMRKIVR